MCARADRGRRLCENQPSTDCGPTAPNNSPKQGRRAQRGEWLGIQVDTCSRSAQPRYALLPEPLPERETGDRQIEQSGNAACESDRTRVVSPAAMKRMAVNVAAMSRMPNVTASG